MLQLIGFILIVQSVFGQQQPQSVTITRNLQPFNSIAVFSSLNVDVRVGVLQGNQQENVDIRAPNNTQANLISTTVANNTLTIQATGPINNTLIRVTVNAEQIINIESNEWSAVRVVEGQLGAIGITLVTRRGSLIVANVGTRRLDSRSEGSGTFQLSGNAEGANVYFQGAVLYNALNLASTNTYIEGLGAINALIDASSTIFGTVEGAATIHYKNDPIRDLNVTGYLEYFPVPPA